jgi:thiol-disulfide isomerase/thioredoxin
MGGVLVLALAGLIGRYLYMLPGFSDGEQAPEISATTLKGQAFQLSDLRGDYVLLDFWGSWCGPCLAENPRLVQLYSKYGMRAGNNNHRFHIVGIAVEQNPERWKRSIEKTQLNWPYQILDQASSLRFFDSPIAKEYGVKQVPTKYLIDPRGDIIAVNPTVEELDQLLEEKL